MKVRVLIMMRLLLRLLSAGPHLLVTCNQWVRIQLELLRIEIALEKQRFLQGLLMLMTAWMMMSFGILMLTALALLISWESYKIPMLGILSFLFLSVGITLLIAARKKLQFNNDTMPLEISKKKN